ncbi:hypothetical protein EJB05_18104 [Eragrostis curvula]|uniref:Uncharacterized protein n=1 Tax=Eragrostis curvula TaxID=38414 RepID=A0A5J9VJ39_9POAL|nr:hypothetical protein EJB05_18104 [Eragrostis curvula]
MEPTRRGKKRLLLVLPLSILCLAVLFASAASPAPAGRGMKRRWAGFDYYVLALQWPGTICRQTSNCCATNGCCRPKPIKWFTIHGLWPQYSYGGWPSCCRPATFNINKVPDFRKFSLELDVRTTASIPFISFALLATDLNVEAYTREVLAVPILRLFFDMLWWKRAILGARETHGTCAYPEIQDEYDYFSTALYLYSKYNVTKALRKAHIYPRGGRKYSVGHIVAAIEYAFGAMPSVVCNNGSVQELRLCFHKDYQPRDCAFETENAPNRRSHCPRYITFPSYNPSGKFSFPCSYCADQFYGGNQQPSQRYAYG